jgi:hypothetical protein
MKKISIFLVLFLALVNRSMAQYFVTNDLQVPFILFYWTNNSTTTIPTNVFTLSTNTGPTTNYVISASTNGPTGLGIEATNATMYMLMPFTNMPFGTNLLSSFFTNSLASIQPATETVPQIQSILKSYYITGAVPSQQNYWEWIDSMFWYINSIYTNSVQTSSNANYITSISPIVGSFTFCLSNAAPFLNLIQTNGIVTNVISAVTQSGGPSIFTYGGTATAWFSTPFADTNYGFWTANQIDEQRGWITVSNVTPSNIVFAISVGTGGAGQPGSAMAIHMKMIVSK